MTVAWGIGGTGGASLGEAVDLLEIEPPEIRARGGDHFDAADIIISDQADYAEFDEEPEEPSLAAAPFFVEFDEPARLDPDRPGLIWEIPPAVSQWAMRRRSPLLALAFHLLPVAAIIAFPLLMVEPPAPIPVQLVIEQTPPEPEPQPVEQPPTPQPAHAEAQSQPVQPAPVQPAPVQPAPVQPAPAPPTPRVRTEAQTSRPTPPPPPKPAPVSHPAKPPLAPASTPPRPQEAPIAQFPDADASRDGYLTYLVTLTQQHMDLLPRSLVGSRRGVTVLSVTVRRDGVIDRIAVAQPSGYPDIDNRIEQMVAAVGRFPPVPDAFVGSPVELALDFLFPEALQAH
ncbi:MAG TPA: energy transducer TonB [Stellaceae bacterium]|nr:energy transducer TonB [Stellaceae bacterium]